MIDNFIFRFIWLHFILPFELKILGVKILFSSLNYCPILIRLFDIKSILFIHTVMPWEYPELLPGSYLKNKFIKKANGNFNIILTKNNSSPLYAKSNIANKVKKDPSVIKVVNLAQITL